MDTDEVLALSEEERAEVADEIWIGPLENLGALGNGTLSISTQMAPQEASDLVISTGPQLQAFARQVNAGVDFAGFTVSLHNDLIITSGAWTPIGTPEHPFNGTFDGAGHFIQNITIDTSSILQNAGFFGYAGDSAAIRDFSLKGGRLSVSNAVDGKTVSDVGAIAGHLGGSISGCASSMPVAVTNDGAIVLPSDTSGLQGGIIMNIGGLVGSLGGDMADCSHTATLAINSKTNVLDGCTAIGGYIGGLVGLQGDPVGGTGSERTIRGCTNAGALVFAITGSGGRDRFGERLYAKTGMVGGVAGYVMGSVAGCSNTADISTGIEKNGAAQAGWGASTTGGIVGSLRSVTFRNSFIDVTEAQVGAAVSDPGYDAWKKSAPTPPTTVRIDNCKNTGKVTGLSVCGGICGSAGAFSVISGCANTGQIEGTRWNKPTPAGIVGATNGNVCYCYNQGRAWSTTGGGFYASGIAGMLTTYNKETTPDEQIMPLPEMYGCYVTAPIGGTYAGYRTAVLAGENEGLIHDNCFLPNLTADKGEDEDIFGDKQKHSNLVGFLQTAGTLADNHELSTTDMKTGLAVSYLNRVISMRDDWSLHYVLVPGGFPKLNWEVPGFERMDIAAVASGADAITVTDAQPCYSPVAAPVPRISITAHDGTILYQDCDFRVVADPSAPAGTNASDTLYTATVEGINAYQGELEQTVAYSISKAPVSGCTIQAGSRIFNWKQQEPAWIKLLDASGAEVPATEFTWSVPKGDPDDFQPKSIDGKVKYRDYVNVHDDYCYDVTVTASPDSVNYEGETTQAVFKITYASLSFQPANQGKPDVVETAVLGDVVYGDMSWNIKDAMEKPGSVKIKYTGSEICPTVASVTYKGRELRNGTGKDYWKTLKYDYRYIYGNPNPSETSPNGVAGGNVNVTGSDEKDLACMTVRWVASSSFMNYTNVFFEIVPASVADDVSVSGVDAFYAYEGEPIRPTPVLTYNGMTLAEGTDYTLSYANDAAAGTASLTIAGKGNYCGTRVIPYVITRTAASPQISLSADRFVYNGKRQTPAVTVTVNGRPVAASDYRIAWPSGCKNAGTYKVKVTLTGGYSGSAKATFKIAKATPKAAVSAKTVKYASVKKKAQSVAPISVTKGAGAATFAKVAKGSSKLLSVNKRTGKVTVAKGTKKGTYRIKVKVTVKANANYAKLSKTVTATVRVK